MIDREKVIKGLEIHTGLLSSCEDGCPYFIGDGSKCKDLLKDALSLLKEQEAVPVIQREVMHMLFWCCGSCGVAITDGDKFCRICGRPVKWKRAEAGEGG